MFLALFCFSRVYAIDMFLTSSQPSTGIDMAESDDENVSEDTDVETVTEDAEIEKMEAVVHSSTESMSDSDDDELIYTTGTSIPESAPVITTSVTRADNSLTVSDIINIILIAVCVVLVFLAIAILIRCN